MRIFNILLFTACIAVYGYVCFYVGEELGFVKAIVAMVK